jgi:hypothetical protein
MRVRSAVVALGVGSLVLGITPSASAHRDGQETDGPDLPPDPEICVMYMQAGDDDWSPCVPTQSAKANGKRALRRSIESDQRRQRVNYPQAIPDILYENISVTDCANNSRSWEQGGWIKNHFWWCEQWRFYYSFREPVTHVELGSIKADVMVRVRGSNGGVADTTFYSRITRLELHGAVADFPEDWDLAFTSGYYDDGDQDACVGGSSSTPRNDTLLEWFEDSDDQFVHIAPAEGSGPEKRSYCEFFPLIIITDPIVGEVEVAPSLAADPRVNGSHFRCDWAGYIKFGTKSRPGGCIFDWVTPNMTYWREGEGVMAVADHITQALTNPSSTAPSYPEKFIPGASGHYIHRNYHNWALKRASQTKVRNVCKRRWPNYVEQGKDCDEFPFNSTLESAAAEGVGKNFSAKPVPLRQNRTAGNQLSRWYFYDRVLHGDHFWVKIFR